MSYHAYLITLHHLLNDKTLDIKDIEEEKIVLDYSQQDIQIHLPTDDINSQRFSRAEEIMATNANLLGIDYPKNDKDKCIAYLLLEDYLEYKIDVCWFNNNIVFSIFEGGLITIEKPWLDLESLHIAKLIREGYTLKENVGENVLVTSPKGVRIVCTPFECQCSRGHKDCDHKKIVRHFIKNRDCFNPLRPDG